MPSPEPSRESEDEWMSRCTDHPDIPDGEEGRDKCFAMWQTATEKSDTNGDNMNFLEKIFGNEDDIEKHIEKIEKLHGAGGLSQMDDDELMVKFTKLSSSFKRVLGAGRALANQLRGKGIDLPDNTLAKALRVFSGKGSMANKSDTEDDDMEDDVEDTEKSQQVLKGQGPDNPTVAFVGANPSRLDMVRKNHFSGPVGRTLQEKYLDPAGVDSGDIYKTTVVKSFLSDEDGPRQPTGQEIEKSVPDLMEELQEVEPDFVVALGKKARQALGDVADEFVPHPRAINIHGDSGEAPRKMGRLGRKVENGESGKKLYKSEDTEEETVREAEIVKTDDEQQIVYGIAYEPGVEDADGNWADEEAIEKAAHRYLSYFQNADHEHLKSIDAWPVESYIAKTDFELGDQPVQKGSWVVALKVNDDDAWQRVKEGEYTGFSIGALANIDPNNQLN